jgi:hypothetical protein
MSYSPLSMARRHVLGDDLYARCESIKQVPVYLAVVDDKPELLGHADEALGPYADAFSFHLADDFCKRLSSGQYTYSFEYDYVGPSKPGVRRRIRLRSITLNARKGYPKPVPKSAVTV